MKSKPNRIEKGRLFRDKMFTYAVTTLGLFVVSIFALIIFQITYNALPLFSSPTLELKSNLLQVNEIEKDYKNIGVLSWQDKWLHFYQRNCSLHSKVLFDESATQRQYKKYAKDCSVRAYYIPNSSNAHIALLRSDNTLELYRLDQRRNLQIVGSVSLLASAIDLESVDNLHINFNQNNLVIEQQLSNTSVLAEFDISSINAPTMFSFEGASRIYPISLNHQYLSVSKDSIHVLTQNGKALQTIENVSNIVSSAMTDSKLDLLVVTRQTADNEVEYHLQKYSFVNQQGIFLLQSQFDLMLPIEVTSNSANINFDFAFDLANNAAFISTSTGEVFLYNLVSGEIVNSYRVSESIGDMHFAANQIVLSNAKRISLFTLNNPSGFNTSATLFGKNSYSAYPEPDYVWQTSVAGEKNSPKYSVVPLIVGSLKASILALLVAVPLALGAAVFTSYFAASSLRNAIKPSIEMLEAIPSVIIGFIAAVWLAPFAETYLLSIFVVLVSFPVIVVLLTAMQGYLESFLAVENYGKWQFLINASLLVIGLSFVFSLSVLLSDSTMGNSESGITATLASLSLSKTAIVVSLALGIAIAPTIYTLIDDALHDVPEGIKTAAFALGANKIQTLLRVVLVVALPSIISAIMLGFGRAFGETMIVLMVTGNTPIANWDLLSGLRTLTSNLAIELQEAQVDSTLYHVLFLTAALLFVFTFVINTVAAVIKRKFKRTSDLYAQ